MKIVVCDSPRVILSPTINYYTVPAQIRNIKVSIVAIVWINIDNRISEKRIRCLVGIFQSVHSKYLVGFLGRRQRFLRVVQQWRCLKYQ